MSYPLPATYRYALTRELVAPWRASVKRTLCWVMLNPSTADEALDDPTIRRVKQFSRDLSYTNLVVVNLFAVRSTDPSQLELFEDPVGPENDTHTIKAMAESLNVVFAWGASGIPCMKRNRIARVMEIADNMAFQPKCLGKTKDGSPRHPLYVKGDTKLVPY